MGGASAPASPSLTLMVMNRATAGLWMVLGHNGAMWTTSQAPAKTWSLLRGSLTTPGHMRLVPLHPLEVFSVLLTQTMSMSMLLWLLPLLTMSMSQWLSLLLSMSMSLLLSLPPPMCMTMLDSTIQRSLKEAMLQFLRLLDWELLQNRMCFGLINIDLFFL